VPQCSIPFEDKNLEKRYTEVARAALEGGTELANNQI